jgi:HK97 family phage major capsid protein
MAFKAGAASPVPAYMPPSGLNVAPYGTLLGRPVLPMMGAMSALGDVGDIILADFSYYIAAVKSAGIKQAVSSHVYFDRDLTAFKFTFRVAGQCPYKAPVQTEKGSYNMSGFVTLAAR